MSGHEIARRRAPRRPWAPTLRVSRIIELSTGGQADHPDGHYMTTHPVCIAPSRTAVRTHYNPYCRPSRRVSTPTRRSPRRHGTEEAQRYAHSLSHRPAFHQSTLVALCKSRAKNLMRFQQWRNNAPCCSMSYLRRPIAHQSIHGGIANSLCRIVDGGRGDSSSAQRLARDDDGGESRASGRLDESVHCGRPFSAFVLYRRASSEQHDTLGCAQFRLRRRSPILLRSSVCVL